jgi:hypothetical protein
VGKPDELSKNATERKRLVQWNESNDGYEKSNGDKSMGK